MIDNKINSIGDYDTIMSDRNIFNQVVYTPLSDALRLLEERQKDVDLVSKIEKLLKGGVPKILKNKKCGIMARQLATPNNENRMFISLAYDNNLYPVFIEYFEDKFTSNNKYKHSLGQLHIENKIDKNGSGSVDKINIIDFNKYDGKKLKEINTLWGESLVDFHRKLFNLQEIENVSFFNEMDWYEKKGETVEEFYVNFFILVTCFGVLFENFLTLKDNNEGDFTKRVVLPALDKAMSLTGLKPLIVPIEALDLEVDDFWYHHLPIVKNLIK
jgi:hypothetical protein